ncbi:sorting nexin-17-like [Brachionus plicatilis]|uniref:Sorting nexin-17 n=1 Tax=Brachionus plicatilis TaxID=10195 RepID=A0A3M7PE45_BRAPC|nr:sorting nexin-17-like [Brachionus plicatilis]
MHFSIPDTEDCSNESGTYTLFKVSINGAHHCSVRYSQLHNLNEQLKNEFGELIPDFPPKKLFSLNSKGVEERRNQLEKYLQIISQNQIVMNSDCLVDFFTNAQQEMFPENEFDVDLVVYLMNYQKVVVNIKSHDQTENVLEKIMDELGLEKNNVYYFGIYLVKKDEVDSIKIVRKIQDFESPYISLQNANKSEKHRLIIRKSYFELSFEAELYFDKVAIDLLYYQAVDELEKGQIIPDNESIRSLEQLKNRDLKLEFIKLIASQKFYGFMHFRSCIVNYPEANIKANLKIGKRSIIILYDTKNTEEEIVLKITRIKCWKVSGMNTYESGNQVATQLELSIEYLSAKNKLTIINIQTDQAILISTSVQTMVDEILLKKDGKKIKRPSDRQRAKATQFLTRNKSLVKSGSANQNTDSETTSLESNLNLPADYSKNDLFENEDFITNDDL